MKAITAFLAASLLAGCTNSFLASHTTSFTEQSHKSPLDYVQCLEPQWQAPGTSTSKIKTQTGYTLEVSSAYIGPIALAVIERTSSGSDVDVYLPTAQGRAARWEDAAKGCL
jgi:hypothetical protein